MFFFLVFFGLCQATHLPHSILPRAKKTKDPNAPKRPASAFLLYSIKRRPDIKSQHPDWTVTEISKHLGTEWKELSDEDKAPFIKTHAENKKKVRS